MTNDPLLTAPAELTPPPSEEQRVVCPSCGRYLRGPFLGTQRCEFCSWKGEVYVFDPVPSSLDRAEHALPEDSVCMHHPSKKATAICAGTGDYICALCAVELKGETYSASYLSNAGKEKVGAAFDRYLERPDNYIVSMITMCFVPYVNFVFLPTAPIWVPYGFFLYFKCLKIRKTNPLFRRVMGTGSVVAIPILLIVFSILWLVALIGIIYAISKS